LFTLANLSRVALTEGKSVGEAPLRLVVEDDYPLQGVVEDFRRQGGFDAHILSSGEEALTCSGQDRRIQGARHRLEPEGYAERLGSRQANQGKAADFRSSK
jgi:hypothetical protein